MKRGKRQLEDKKGSNVTCTQSGIKSFNCHLSWTIVMDMMKFYTN